MNNKGRKSLAMIIVIITLGATAAISAGKTNRWSLRFTKDAPKEPSTTVTTAPSDGKADKVTEGSNKTDKSTEDLSLHCRAGSFLVNRVFDGTSGSQGSSAIPVPDAAAGGTAPVSCMSAVPPLISMVNTPVQSGSILLRCRGGNWGVESSTCTASGGNQNNNNNDNGNGGGNGGPPSPGTPPPPPPPPPPVPEVDPAFPTKACSSECSAVASTCTRTTGGKNGGDVNYRAYACKSGQFYVYSSRTGSYTCGKNPCQ